MNLKSLPLFIVLTIFSAIIGYFVGKNSIKIPLFSEQRHQGSYQFINPLLECDSASFSSSAALDDLRHQVSITIDELKNSNQISFASLYYRDLNNGPWFGINEKELFSPASLVKVPIMITYFKKAESDPSFLTQSVTLENQNTYTQNIPPSVTLSPEKTYTYEDLIENMIIYSDNQSYETLQKNIDNNLLVHTYSDLGIDISKAYDDPAGNIISVKSYAAFFRILFNASYLNKEYSEKALKILSQIKYTDALVKGVNNPNITISHKFGERTYESTGEKQLHDCGIVYAPNKPYLICIMTRGTDFSKLSNSIAKLSNIVFQSITSNLK